MGSKRFFEAYGQLYEIRDESIFRGRNAGLFAICKDIQYASAPSFGFSSFEQGSCNLFIDGLGMRMLAEFFR